MVKLTRMKLVNYIGPYIGMGIKEFEINRSDSINNIILLLGSNGSGKTSIITEMSPLPLEHLGARTKSRIIDGEVGIKELDYLVDDVVVYKVKIVFDPKKTTKCFMTRILDGKETELNPNGNVEPYIECLSNYLHMDKNYTSIGYLSKDIKNFVAMKPAERNSFISEWMPEISEFLDAYKISSKTLSKLKKQISSYNNEIGNMSSVNYELELNFLNSNISNLQIDLERTTKDITELSVYQSQIEPFVKSSQDLESFKLKWFENYNKTKKTKSIIDEKYQDLTFINVNNKEEIDEKISFHTEMLKTEKNTLSQLEDSSFMLQSEISSTKSILSTNDKISNTDLNMLMKNIDESKNLLKEMIESRIITENNYSLFNPEDLIVDDDTLGKIPFILDILETKFVQLNNLISLDYIKNMDNLEQMITEKESDKENITLIISDLNKEISKVNNEIYKYEHGNIDTEILMKRPDFCKMEKCGIVSELMKYLDPKKSLSDMYDKSKDLQMQLHEFSGQKEEIDNSIFNVRKSYNIYVEIIDYMHKNDEIIAKFPLPIYNFFSKEPVTVYTRMNEIKGILEDITEYNSIVNKIEETNKIVIDMNNLKDMVVANSQIKGKLNSCLSKYEEISNKKRITIDNLEFHTEKLNLYSNVFDRIAERDKDINECNLVFEELEDLKIKLMNVNKMSYTYNSNHNRLDVLNSKKLETQTAINKANTKRDEMTTFYISKRQVEKLRNELQTEFNSISILNKIWSPKIGYPSLKIEAFLNNLTVQTNEDLNKMWGTSMRIEKFKIDASDFAIIVNNNGTIVDDASLLSTGETSILNTAISFSMIQMNIDKCGYDVVRLDEVDGCLDDERRQGFINMIQGRLEDIGCDTCGIITHNDEFTDIPCDVILLKNANISDEKLKNKNILFRY